MAVSAFRSTTKRSCQIGSAESNGPAMPGSKTEATSRKGIHRRSRSVSDFSQKYLSDSEYRGRHGGRSSSRYMSSDSESDMEAANGQHRGWQGNFGSGLGREFASSVRATDTYHSRHGFRRTSNHQDPSAGKNSRRGIILPHCGSFGVDHPENVEEEKTISAVYAQIKSMKRSCLSEGNSEGSSPAEFMSTDVIQAVTDIRKEYAAKLEQSEKRVHELWSQLAIEEQRCLEFAKIVKELLPAASPSLQKVSHRRKASAEKQLVSKWLDEEAHKYFEECVSISSLDSSGGLDIPQEKDQQGLLHAVQDDAGKTRKGTTGLDQQITRDRSSLNEDAKQSKGDIGNDGVVLPWLQWGAERGIGERNSIKGVHSYFSPSSSSNSNSNPSEGSKCSTFVNGFSTSSSSSGSTTVRGSPPNAQASTTTKSFSTGTGIVDYEEINHGARNEQAKLGKETKPRRSTMAGSSTQDGKEYADLPCCDSDCLIAERIKFSHRIERGQLLLCGDISF
eukprot:c25823_g1_i3 orf=165-1679(-)